ncbi:MAG TPA: substrate-binding domain-containing protein [Candidatus Solibacter sp.]|nr:substrate-binding domain-containing protein [Candidatus Solibacter sp.]
MSSKRDITTARRRGAEDPSARAEVYNRLAHFREQRGIAAADLARQAGVSRQTIYAMEAGDYVPNTAVALRLARVLETTVEELFRLEGGAAEPRRTARAEVIGPGDRFAGTPVELCRVDGKLVAVPVVPAPWQLPPTDGLLVDPTRSEVQMLRGDEPGMRLLIAGCDPAVSVLARHLQRANVELVAAPVNSSVALELLEKRLTHVAGTHLSKAPEARAKFEVFRLAVWEQGLVVARGNPKKIRTMEDLARPVLRLANRERGSGSRQLLDSQLRAAGIPKGAVPGYDDEPATGHLAAAWRVYAGIADSCIATRSAAWAFGLDFLPLASERYDLVFRKEHRNFPPVARLLETLQHAVLRRELETLCGYDTRDTGRRVESPS